ncbi:MAG: leukotoxin LktA family filamentous adhesin [Candidatus Melainabacteria bacterium]|nr:MAG: leukotoxin LktA family filamentous adhesin [Candidatus Melainabacteria bacterium]
MAFATNITGVNGNNGVYNINPSSVKGSTGFRQYKDFTLDSGHTANLIFGGINRFVNAVDNQVTINGILNSVNGSGAFANGRAIFVSPKGFVVGSSGVVNVGSLGVYTPSSSAYNSFKNLSVDKMTDALLNGDAYYGNGAITISGMILTREALDLKGSTVNINNTAKIASGILDKNTNTMLSQDNIAKASSAANARNNATTLFNKLVNSGKANFSSDEFDFANNNGNITIVAKDGIALNGTTVANGSYFAQNKVSGKLESKLEDVKYINGNYTLSQQGNAALDSLGQNIVNGNIHIAKAGRSWLNVGGKLTNIKEGGTTYIGNESSTAGALTITGKINTKGDIRIRQRGHVNLATKDNPYIARAESSSNPDGERGKALLYIGKDAEINIVHDNGGDTTNNAKLLLLRDHA